MGNVLCQVPIPELNGETFTQDHRGVFVSRLCSLTLEEHARR